MPANTTEVIHYHHETRQFFFILSGVATMKIHDQMITLNPQEGIEVPPLTEHQMRNDSDQDVEFLVISQPNSRGDRINL